MSRADAGARAAGSCAAAGGAEPCDREKRGQANGAATGAAGSRGSSRGQRERRRLRGGRRTSPARWAPRKPDPPPVAHWCGCQSPTSHWWVAYVTEGPGIPLLGEEGETPVR